MSLLPQFYPARLENSAVRGNDRQNPPPENKLIPRLIEVALVQMRRLAVHASCQFSDYLKPDPFGLCSDSHIHFLLNPLTSIIWLFNLVYIIAPYLSQKLPSMEMAVKVLMSGFLSMSGKRILLDKTAAWLTSSPPNRYLFSSFKTLVEALKNDCAN